MPKAIRWIINFFCVTLTLALLLSALVLLGGTWLNSPPAPANNAQTQNILLQDLKNPAGVDRALSIDESGVMLLEVRSGETAYSVGRRLESAGVIRNRYFWYALSRLGKEYIKTGTYRIELPVSQIAIYSVLVAGEQLLYRVTIPEGVTLKKIARILEDEGICGAEDFLAAASSREILTAYNIPGETMEGFLYPDTYLFPAPFPASRVVSVMADTFFKRLREIIPDPGADLAGLNEKVIIASIVEREYRIPDEAALMAGVFYNRLNIGMALQSCATVEYVITEIQNRPHPEVLYNRDLEIRDLYNTYMYPGLPPGPISAPGKTALTAVFFPVETNYLYFRLVDPDAGRHYFSRTLDDHIRAGSFYLKAH